MAMPEPPSSGSSRPSAMPWLAAAAVLLALRIIAIVLERR